MNKNNKILLIIIAILVVVILVLLLSRMPKGKTPVTQIQAEQNIEVANDKLMPVTTTAACVDTYKSTEESKVSFEESDALITNIDKRCDGAYYITVDYLSPGNDNPDDDIGFYDNTNFKLRTFKVAQNFDVKMIYGDYFEKKNSYQYLATLQKYPHGATFGRDAVYWRYGAFSNVYKLKIQNGVVIAFDEVYLP